MPARRRPADAWLDRLKEGGRLILPLTADAFPNRDVRRGAVFRIERHGPEFLPRRISGVAIFPCEGGRDEAGERGAGRRFREGRRRAREPVIPARRFAGRPMLAARAGLVPGLPLMLPAFYIRPARVEEAAALSDLCFRSKAVWGYDPEFMALMLAALGVAGEDIAAGDVWVATGADGQIAGSCPAATTPTGPKGSAPARRDRCEIAPANSPTSGCSRRAIPCSQGLIGIGRVAVWDVARRVAARPSAG
jgi:hypothetical protein